MSEKIPAEPIIPNDKDSFSEEKLSDSKIKITFRESFLIIEFKDDDFIVHDNKCKNLYDLRKIYGFISSKNI